VEPDGYPLEQHFATTDDGYILGLYRVPHGRPGSPGAEAAVEPSPAPKPVVLLMHGLLCSGAEFLLQGPGLSLGQILADAGFDVWLGNARGNTFSRAHTHLSVSSAQFWAFSWDDTAGKDLPTLGRYVLSATGALAFAYVAHSQGTTVGLAALSSDRGFAEQVQVGSGLAAGGAAAGRRGGGAAHGRP
jgi:lysosomal acid lipase/cholesteryl ester hydrolase/gastric triacylglycerol lipase